MEEENSIFPPFQLSFEIFNYNVHNYLADSGTGGNVMPRINLTTFANWWVMGRMEQR